jgi:adenylate kinase
MYFEASDSTLVSRLLSRGATSGREDDNEETIKKRLDTFHTHNDPIINHFKSKLKQVNNNNKFKRRNLANIQQ